jgi:tetratricopeptide (TPR) repeat protein
VQANHPFSTVFADFCHPRDNKGLGIVKTLIPFSTSRPPAAKRFVPGLDRPAAADALRTLEELRAAMLALEALTRALGPAREEPEVLARLARADALRGRWEQALAFANKALDLRAPFDVLPLYAEALARTGNCPHGAFVTEQLARLADEPRATQVRRTWQEKLNPICEATAAALAPKETELPAAEP